MARREGWESLVTGYDPAKAQYPGYYGEMEGYIFNRYTSSYHPDPVAQQAYYEQQGLIPKAPEAPGVWDQLKPLAYGTAITEGTKLIGKHVAKPVLEWGADGVGDLFTSTSSSGGLGGLLELGSSSGGEAVGSALTGTGGAGTLMADGSVVATGGEAVGSALTGTGGAGTLMADGSVVAGEAAAEGGLLGLGSSAMSSLALPVIGAVMANQFYEQGGKEVFTGKADRGDWINSAININPVTFWVNSLLKPFGTSVGSLFGGEKTTAVEGDRLKNVANKIKEAGGDPSRFLLGYDPNDNDSGFKDTTENRTAQLQKVMEENGVDENFRGWTKDGRYLNTKWLSSGEEEDLGGVDIANSSAVLEQLLSSGALTVNSDPLEILKAKFDYADKALAAGAVREHHGTIDIDGDKVASFSGDYTPKSWDEFKFNTSVQSVLEQVERGKAASWEEELQRRIDLEPEWTDWNAVRNQIQEINKVNEK